MTLASNSMRSPRQKRLKKPPACDSCKARRVLCHPQPEGIPCPRCAEKGKATEEIVSSPSEEPQASTSIVTVRPRIELSDVPELPPELVKTLVESFVHFPECRFPLFCGDRLKAALGSVSWHINLLPPQLQVLASCACALSASISFDPAIIGPGPAPISFADRSVFFSDSDLRIYGARRAPMCRALYERAFTLACETRIHIDVSEDNAASCFFLDVLERLNETTFRPWAVAYVSHSRIIVGSRDDVERHRPNWAGFIMAEALAAVTRRMPVLFSHTDQLLMGGNEPPPLEQLSRTLQAMHQSSKKVSSIVFTAIVPYYARRHPLAEASVIELLSSLSILQSILTLVLDHLQLSPGAELLFYEFPGKDPAARPEEDNLRACAFAMSIGFTNLVLALYQEIEHRVSAQLPTAQNRWIQERTGILQRQVHEMTGIAVVEFARSLQLLPSLPHIAHLELGSVRGWIDFCLAEAATTGPVPPDRVKVFETLVSALKLFGYFWDIPRSSELIEKMEAYVARYKASSSDSSLSPNLALAQIFPFDNNWTGMFGMDQCDLTAYGSDHTLVSGFL
ncbi:hypothetical protein B0H19DRAFT_1107144 [Mycena capillaripes]|nr:hypothetical protein B0H19DRAFT_1107144 [Mycena capillaripes]